MRPMIYIRQETENWLRSVAELQESVREGHPRVLWDEVIHELEETVDAPPLLPSSTIPGRSPLQAQHANADYTICHAAGRRVLQAALAHLLTGEVGYRDAALRQCEALLDPRQWPEWRDQAHPSHEADLRTGMLARDLAIAYDWLHEALTPAQRAWLVEGLDRRAIQPFWRSVEAGMFWAEKPSNWMTCIVGGLGITGMALRDDHPDSDRLIEFSLPRMRNYLSIYGPEGEFNESVAYSNSTLSPARYFLAYRCWSGGRENVLAEWPFAHTCRWLMRMTLPPGRVAAFGDSHLDGPPAAALFAAVAGAAGDRVLQWFYLNHLSSGREEPHFSLLWFDPTLTPLHPREQMPLGRAYPAEGQCMSSRSDWNPRATHCVLYAKGGAGTELHGHHDVGQICIDGFGRPLIVDLGSPSLYPKDFFSANRYQYYNASVTGHNVLSFGGREMRCGEQNRAEILRQSFDDRTGGLWQLDLSALYDGARHVRRSAIHLLPGIVCVLDEAKLEEPEKIALRWHTADRCAPDNSGRFLVTSGSVHLAGLIQSLTETELSLTRREHRYEPPFDKGRLGDPLEQRRESYIHAACEARQCRVLTLFAIFAPGQTARAWETRGTSRQIQTPEGLVDVKCDDSALHVRNLSWGTAISCPL